MKNLIIYYFQILLPIPLLYFSIKHGDSVIFATLFVFYYIYRSFTDYYRLLRKKMVEKNNFFMFFMPLWHIKYFKELYFEK
jgi:hypothetical protein